VRRGWLLASLVLALLPGCAGARRDDEGLPAVRSHVYRYTAWSEDGREVVRGWIHLDKTRRGVTGEWWLQAVGNRYPIGGQRGRGTLVGTRREGRLVLELHPERRDDNVVLVETGSGRNLSGTWEWSTIAGVAGRGTWRAVRHEEAD
jgi:hypothetical protein